jgi:uncharacterized protein (DUF1697 family)
MPAYAVLLRGVNLGSHNRIAMPKLRAALTDAGYEDVQTYVASGNVILRTAKSEAALVEDVRAVINGAFRLDIPVTARTATQLAKVAGSNPFEARADNVAKQLHVAFLSGKPSPARVKDVDPHRDHPEELKIAGREVFAWCPNGIGRSKVLNGIEKALGVESTVRNWRTVTELLRMTSS